MLRYMKPTEIGATPINKEFVEFLRVVMRFNAFY